MSPEVSRAPLVTVLDLDGLEQSSSRHSTVDVSEPPGRPSWTVAASPARATPSVVDDLRCPLLDDVMQTSNSHADGAQRGRTLGISNAVDAGNLSTQLSSKFAENFQRGMNPTVLFYFSDLCRALLNKVTDGNTRTI